VEKTISKDRMMQLMLTHEAQLAESYDVEIAMMERIRDLEMFC
jgi:hypothetical protein